MNNKFKKKKRRGSIKKERSCTVSNKYNTSALHRKDVPWCKIKRQTARHTTHERKGFIAFLHMKTLTAN